MSASSGEPVGGRNAPLGLDGRRFQLEQVAQSRSPRVNTRRRAGQKTRCRFEGLGYDEREHVHMKIWIQGLKKPMLENVVLPSSARANARVHQNIEQLAKSKLIGYDKKFVSIRVGQGFVVPAKFYTDKYMSGLSMKAKYLYLICLLEASNSTKYPEWFRSQQDMGKLYGISGDTISTGLLELEAKGVIQVTRDKPKPPDYSDRNANVYRMMNL